MRFVHSRDKVVDLKIFPDGNTLHLRIQRPENSAAQAGFTIDIDSIMKIGRSLTTNRVVAVASKVEIASSINGDPALKLKKYLALLVDRDITMTAFQVVSNLLPAYVKGMFSLSTRLVKQKIDDIVTGAASLN